MATTKKKTLSECLEGQQWYRCPLPLTTFFVFLILFLYAIFVLIKCSSLIKEHSNEGDVAFQAKYGKKITDITKVYVINMIVMILSLIVLVFFLHKAIPVSRQSQLFNEYLGAFIVLFVFVVSAWTLAMFNSMKVNEGPTSAITATILVVSMIGLGVYGYQIYKYMKPAGPSHSGTHSASQQQQFHDARSS
jgi:predicted ABC-type exoprotein transport system permease subunit